MITLNIRSVASFAAILFAPMLSYAQTFQPSDPYDSPTSDIEATESLPGKYQVYGIYSETYGLLNGISPDINIRVHNDKMEWLATGVNLLYGAQSDASMRQLGTLAGNVEVISASSSVGVFLNGTGMAQGAEIAANIVARSDGYDAYGLWINNGPVSDQHYIFSGTIDARSNGGDYSAVYGIDLRLRENNTFELKNASIYTEGGATYGTIGIMMYSATNLLLSGNNRIEAMGRANNAFALMAGSTPFSVWGDTEGVQTLIGGIYASGSAGTGAVAFKTGNFVIDSTDEYMLIYSPDVDIEQGVSMNFKKDVCFMGRSAYKGNVMIDGELILNAQNIANNTKIFTQYADLSIGDNAKLTLVLDDTFTYNAGDTMLLVEHNVETDTIIGSFADNFEVRYENGSILQNDNYIFDGYTLTFIPETSTYAAIFGALALAFAAYRRRK